MEKRQRDDKATVSRSRPMNCSACHSNGEKLMKNGWIGCDLDGTLAFYDGWRGETHIGKPIPQMVERVKSWLAEGLDVRIFTARIAEAENNHDGTKHDIAAVADAIEIWCEKHIGQKLIITNKKDFGMICLYDDRAIQVEANTGRLLNDGQE